MSQHIFIAFRKGKLYKIDRKEATWYNERKYGIFRTVNRFEEGSRLTKDNVSRISYWYVDIDEGNKLTLSSVLHDMSLRPTIIVETKRGYHAYWAAVDGQSKNYRTIQRGIMEYLKSRGVKADLVACNINRFLRAPGYFHWKEEFDPFKIRCIWRDTDLRYTEAEMQKYFRAPCKEKAILRGTSSIVDTVQELGIEVIHRRCLCPLVRHRQGVGHISEKLGVPAMQLYPETETFHCFACGITGTSEDLRRLLDETG